MNVVVFTLLAVLSAVLLLLVVLHMHIVCELNLARDRLRSYRVDCAEAMLRTYDLGNGAPARQFMYLVCRHLIPLSLSHQSLGEQFDEQRHFNSVLPELTNNRHSGSLLELVAEEIRRLRCAIVTCDYNEQLERVFMLTCVAMYVRYALPVSERDAAQLRDELMSIALEAERTLPTLVPGAQLVLFDEGTDIDVAKAVPFRQLVCSGRVADVSAAYCPVFRPHWLLRPGLCVDGVCRSPLLATRPEHRAPVANDPSTTRTSWKDRLELLARTCGASQPTAVCDRTLFRKPHWLAIAWLHGATLLLFIALAILEVLRWWTST